MYEFLKKGILIQHDSIVEAFILSFCPYNKETIDFIGWWKEWVFWC